MNNDTSIEGTSRHRDSEINLGRHTLGKGDCTASHDVKDLLKCIKLWKKETKENPKLSMLERFQNLSTPTLNSSNLLLNDEIKKFNNSISNFLLKLGEYEVNLTEENEDRGSLYDDTPEFDKKIISDLNFPIDLNYQRFGVDGLGDKDYGNMSEESSDTRFGTDESDSGNNSYKTSTFTTENESTIGNQMEYKGKKIDPEITYKTKYTEDFNYSKNGNNENKYVDYNNPNYEINRLEDLENVDYRDVEEFKGMIGELINGENYQFPSQLESNELFKKQLEKKDEMTKQQLEQDSMLVGDMIITEREFEDEFEDEFENEENPILSINNRQSAIITENDILSYGKTDSHTEYLPSSVVEDKTGDNKGNNDMIKDISVNSQIDHILSTKEEEPMVEKVRGVCYCKSDNSWTAWWTEKGKSRKKAFKLSLYGYEQARKMAIEHRKQIENMIPELKEKRMKTVKRKITSNIGNKTMTNTGNIQQNNSEMLNNLSNTNSMNNSNMNSNNMSNNMNNTNQSSTNTSNISGQMKVQGSIEKRKQQVNEDGIYKGTRNKIRETLEDQGIYFRDNIWYSTWIDSLGNRIVNSFPVTNDLPFLAAKTKAINSCTWINQAVASGSNNNYQVQGNYQNTIKRTKYKGNNSNYYNNMNLRNHEILKRRKRQLNSSGGSINEGFDHFKNLEMKLEDLERRKFNSNHLANIQRSGQINTQSTIVPQIFVQTPQELKLTSSESNQGTNMEPTKNSPKLSSLHCQIKLDRETIKKIENAINLSIMEKTNQEETNVNNEQQIHRNKEKEIQTLSSQVPGTQLEPDLEKEIKYNNKEYQTNSDINKVFDSSEVKDLKSLDRSRENIVKTGEDEQTKVNSRTSSTGRLNSRENEQEGFKRDGMEADINEKGEYRQKHLRGDQVVSMERPDQSTLCEEKYLENVNALCITQINSDRRTSINIIPTYIMGPQDTQLLTFVILNS